MKPSVPAQPATNVPANLEGRAFRRGLLGAVPALQPERTEVNAVMLDDLVSDLRAELAYDVERALAPIAQYLREDAAR